METKDLIFEFLLNNEKCSISYAWNHLVLTEKLQEKIFIYTTMDLEQDQLQPFLDNGFSFIINYSVSGICVELSKKSICQE